MRTHGNLINRIMEASAQPTPEVGMAVTICYHSDREPGTIIEVKGKTIKIQEDSYKVVSGSAHDGSAVYEYERNPNGRIFAATQRKNGTWKAAGASYGIALGRRERYYDPSF